MAVAKVVAPVIIVTVGPKVLASAVDYVGTTFGVPTADSAPWRKNYADPADFFAAMSQYAEREADRAAEYVAMVKARKVKDGARVVVVVSESAAKHDPKGGTYSKVVSVSDLLLGLSYIADETVTVK